MRTATHLESTICDGVTERTPITENGYRLTTFRGVFYYNADGELHREDGPAAEYFAAPKCPARREYYVDGRRHRVGAPAVEHADGTYEYWSSGKRHRADGAAVVYPNGDQGWYMDGRPHRTDGPAVVFSDGSGAWWICGEQMTESQFVDYVAKDAEIRAFFLQEVV